MQNNSKELRILFLSVFINLAGFAIILPLGPTLMEHYTNPNNGDIATGWVVTWVKLAHSLAESIGHSNANFITEVFFGCLLGSLYGLGQFAFAPIWGRLSDRIGRKPVLLFTIFGTALSYLLWFFASSFELFILARILGGIMAGNLAVSTAAVADLTSRENRSKGMGMIGAAFGLGFIFGPAIGGLTAQINLLQYFPWLEAYGVSHLSFPALIATIFCFINALWLILCFKECLTPEVRKSIQPITLSQRLFGMFTNGTPFVRFTNNIYLLYIILFSGMEFTLPFLAAERLHFDSKANGYLFVYIGLMLVFVQGFLIRKLAVKIPERTLAIFGTVTGLISFAAFALSLNSTNFYIACAFLALSIGLVSPSLSAIVSLLSNENQQGINLGFFRSAGSLGRALGPITAAFFFFYFGSGTTYLVAAGLLIVPTLLLLKLPAIRKTRSESKA